MYLVDTNVISELPKPRPDASVIAWLGKLDSLVISAITVEELAFGVERSRPDQVAKLRPWFDHLMAIPPTIVPVDEPIARTAGLLRAKQEKAGKNAAQADMLIAATALVTARTLVTRNVRHFLGLGVALLNPFSSAGPGSHV